MRRTLLAFVLVAAVAWALPQTACLAERPTVVHHSYSRPDEVVMTHLDLDLAVDFDRSELSGTASIDIDNKTGAPQLILDTWALAIESVTLGDGTPATWALGDSVPVDGRALVVDIGPDTKRVVIAYHTTADSRGIEWLSPAQTLGKHHPYLYTQSQSVLARSWVPCQDIPSVRFTYNARIRVPRGLLALMSARNGQEKTADGVYTFEMPQPIPSYLLALAVGDIEFRRISDRCGVYAEPGLVDAAAWEFADMEKMVETAESMYGPYRWERFDVIVLPPSFPLGGMENPRLTFLTPVLVAGDRSLVAVVVHELGHSWSGNLVTDASWEDFWLNEGFTTYFERRITEALYGTDVMEMNAVLGRHDLDEEFADLGADSPDTRLHVDLVGRDPDEVLGTTPYEKGYLFLRMLEEAVGRERWDAFLRRYFDTFAFQSMSSDRFVAYLKNELLGGGGARAKELHIDEWVYQPGLPSNCPVVLSRKFDEVDTEVSRWTSGTPAAKLDTEGWVSQQWQRFLTQVPSHLSAKQMSELDTTFDFSHANGEVRSPWFLLVIENKYVPAYPALEDFLVTVGRRWLIRGLYETLAETPEGLEWARRVYRMARPGYHAVTAKTIDGILGWTEP